MGFIGIHMYIGRKDSDCRMDVHVYLHAHDKIVVQCIETVQSLVLLLKYPDACLYKFLKILFMVSLI